MPERKGVFYSPWAESKGDNSLLFHHASTPLSMMCLVFVHKLIMLFLSHKIVELQYKNSFGLLICYKALFDWQNTRQFTAWATSSDARSDFYCCPFTRTTYFPINMQFMCMAMHIYHSSPFYILPVSIRRNWNTSSQQTIRCRKRQFLRPLFGEHWLLDYCCR